MKKYILTSTLAALLTLGGLSVPALAGPEDVVVENAWSRASIGMNRPGAAYMTIRNTGDEPVTLTGVSSMSPAGEIAIAPGESVALEPGGLHAMLMRLQEPMTEGDTFPLTLLFDDGGEVTVEVPILGIAARGPED